MTPTLTDEGFNSGIYELKGTREFLRRCARIVREVAAAEGVFWLPVQEEFESFQSLLAPNKCCGSTACIHRRWAIPDRADLLGTLESRRQVDDGRTEVVERRACAAGCGKVGVAAVDRRRRRVVAPIAEADDGRGYVEYERETRRRDAATDRQGGPVESARAGQPRGACGRGPGRRRQSQPVHPGFCEDARVASDPRRGDRRGRGRRLADRTARQSTGVFRHGGGQGQSAGRRMAVGAGWRDVVAGFSSAGALRRHQRGRRRAYDGADGARAARILLR